MFFQFNLLVLCFFFFNSISLFYAFLFLFFCALCFISSNYIVLYVTLISVSLSPKIGHGKVPEKGHFQRVATC